MESSIMTYLLMALALVGVVALVALINALSKIADLATAAKSAADSVTQTSNQASELIAEVRGQIVPTLDKVDVAVDGVNLNLLRLDAILESFEQTSEHVADVSTSVSSLVNAPIDALGNLGDRLRRAWKSRKVQLADELARHPIASEQSKDDSF